MKKSFFKRVAALFTAVLCSACAAFAVSAETSKDVTLSISTDKADYNANETVSITVSAVNGSSYALTDVSVISSLPAGFQINGGQISVNSAVMNPNENLRNVFSIYRPSSSPSTDGNEGFYLPAFPVSPSVPNVTIPLSDVSNDVDNITPPEDISSSSGVVSNSEFISIAGIDSRKFAISFIVNITLIIGISMLFGNNRSIKKLLSLLLSAALMISLCTEFGAIDVFAENGELSAHTVFKYNGQDYTVYANMTYSYENGDNSGTNETEPEISIPEYNIDPAHIVEDEESGTQYIDNEIIIYFVNGYTEKMLKEVEANLKGTIVDCSPEIDKYRFRCNNAYSLAELQNICEQLCLKYDYIEYAYWANIFLSDDVKMSYHSDPWINDGTTGNPIEYNEPFYWDEAFPYGSNYALELINMPTVWDYLKNTKYPEIKIGVADMEFSNNSDLMYSYLFPYSADTNTDNKNFHGTHVAGIIGAKNNSIGMSGILNNALLYCCDCSQLNTSNNNYVIDDDIAITRIYQLISKGCRVVNFSIGDNWLNNDGTYKEIDNKIIEKQANAATQLISKMIINVNKGICEDFIIVQGAGNCSLDAYNNGYFSSITNKNKLPKDAVKNNITLSDIENKVIVVGNLKYDSFSKEYKLADSSNFGHAIDVCAPGENILSTGFNNKMYLESGTSMAAPMVTGVCGLVWSIDPNLSSAQVKELVTNSFNNIVSDSEGNIYHALNAAEVLQKMKANISNDLNQGIIIKNDLKKEYSVFVSYENINNDIYNIYRKDIINTYKLKTSCDIPYVIKIYDSEDNKIYQSIIRVKQNEWFEIDLDNKKAQDYIATITQYDNSFIVDDEI